MLEFNKIYNEDCFETMENLDNNSIDNILTSPFYNTSRKSTSERSRRENESRYDLHIDNLTNDEYIEFTNKLFNEFNRILKKDGCILYNISYSAENTELIWLTIADIIKNTNFTVADDIIWKKKSALPNNTSKNKLTRIVEHIFVFCRKDEFKTFNANKKITKTNSKGQAYYENVFNFIEAKNNDGSCNLNKATFSSELVEKLIHMYIKENSVVYDPFMGTGTTAIGCLKCNCDYIGSELSKAQCEYAENRINTYLKNCLKII